jgi:RsiW-degrading membrane proteinase PrsW (M82 family)
MLVLYSIISLFGAFIWIRYYRLIDIFEHEIQYSYFVSFVLGGMSCGLVLGLDHYYGNFYFSNDGSASNDFFYSFIEIGLVEETSKVLAFLVAFGLLRKHINEPLDYIIHISVIALGFSAFENILYFNRFGADIINSRIVLSSFGHVFDTSFFAYGLIMSKRSSKKIQQLLYPLVYLFLAALAHGVYDFLLIHEFDFNILLFILYFFVMVSIYSTILNNALNVSPYFTYEKVVNPRNVLNKLIAYYSTFLSMQLLILIFNKGLTKGLGFMFSGIVPIGLIMLVILVRLSRFTLIKDRWEQISLTLPFSYGSLSQDGSTRMNMSIKGDGIDEADVGELYGKELWLCPLSLRNTFFQEDLAIKMSEKLFLTGDEIYYKIDVSGSRELLPNEILIKAKTFETTKAREQYPIVAIMEKEDNLKTEDGTSYSNLVFLQWGFLKQREDL